MEWWGYLLTGGTAAAVVGIVNNIIQWKLSRKAKQEDEKRIDVEEIMQMAKTLQMGQLMLLHDRIKFLSKMYIKAGEITFEDLQDLKQMHRIYRAHGGENLVRPIADVEKLEIKY